MNLGRSPADWDLDTWQALRELFAQAWKLDRPDMEAMGRSLYGIGLIVGALVMKGPLLSYELHEVAEGCADATSSDAARAFVRKAILTTEGDRDGLSDLATAMRDGGVLLGMHARRETRDGLTADQAFYNAKAQMLGVSRTSVEEAFGKRG